MMLPSLFSGFSAGGTGIEIEPNVDAEVEAGNGGADGVGGGIEVETGVEIEAGGAKGV